MPDRKVGAALVIGAGIAGMQASLDLAEAGIKVYLVERTPALGGTMAQLDKTFPTNDCAMCSLAPRMVDAGRHINIEKLTYTDLEAVEGEAGHFRARVRRRARSIDPSRCTGCEDCTRSCVVRYRAQPRQADPPAPLAEEEAKRLEAVLARHRAGAPVLVKVLREVQDEFRYLPPQILRHVAYGLGVPLSRVVRVATFYPSFSLTPRGQHEIIVCQGTTCSVRGSERILDALRDGFGVGPGEVSADGRFSVTTGRCFGMCALAPALRVDRDQHVKVRPSGLREILARY